MTKKLIVEKRQKCPAREGACCVLNKTRDILFSYRNGYQDFPPWCPLDNYDEEE